MMTDRDPDPHPDAALGPADTATDPEHQFMAALTVDADPDPRIIYSLLLAIAIVFGIGAGLIAAGLNQTLIPDLQSLGSPAADAFFRFASLLGDPFAYIIIIVVLYWCYDTGLARDLALILLISSFCNGMIKNVVRDPRPPEQYWKYPEDSYGFPSGHAQGASTFWGTIGTHLRTNRRRLVPIVMAVLIALVAISRVYNGVHDIQDITTGVIVGLSVVALAILVRPRLAAWLERAQRPVHTALALGIAVPIVMLITAAALFPAANNDFGLICGGIMGVAVGATVQQRTVAMTRPGSIRIAILRLIIGLAVVGAVFVPLSVLLPDALVFEFVQYSAVAGAALAGAPLLFRRFGLA